MKKGYTVYFTRTKDGKQSSHHYDYSWESGFWWSEGNMSCDCNRYLEFERGLGTDPDYEGAKCSEGKYKIRVILDNGIEVYNEKGGTR